jgi:hypothetical protein
MQKDVSSGIYGCDALIRFERHSIKTAKNIIRKQIVGHFRFPANFDCLATADRRRSAACWMLIKHLSPTGTFLAKPVHFILTTVSATTDYPT